MTSYSNHAKEIIFQNVELFIYMVMIQSSYTNLSWNQIFLLGAVLSTTFSISILLNQSHLISILSAFPILCIATDFSLVPYAFLSSLGAAVTFQKRPFLNSSSLSSYLDIRPWQLAASCLVISMASIGIKHPYFATFTHPQPVQTVMNSAYGKMAALAGANFLIQHCSMKFFHNVASRSFTPSELTLITQLLGSFILNWLFELSNSPPSSPSRFIIISISCIIWLLFWIFQLVHTINQPMSVKISLATAGGGLISTVLWSPCVLPLFAKLVDFFHSSEFNYQLTGIWLVSFVVLTVFTSFLAQNVSNTAARKGFHLTALAIFLTGIVMDAKFLQVATSLSIVLFCMVEFVRWTKIFGTRVSDFLTRMMLHVTNDRDNAGPLTFSHLYLLIGCGFGILMESEGELKRISYSGISSAADVLIIKLAGPLFVLAIGDSAASIIGSKYGQSTGKWPSSGGRSYIGTLAGIISTFISLILLLFFIRHSSPPITTILSNNIYALSISTILTFLLEAYTKNIDNLVLPVFFYTSYQFLSSK